MTADASIYGLIKPATPITDPLEGYAKVQNLRSLMSQNQLHQLQTDKLTRDMEAEDAYNNVLRTAPAGATLESLLPDVMRASPQAGLKLHATLLEQQSKKATIAKDNASASHSAAQTGDISAGQLAGTYAALAKMGGSDDSVRLIESQMAPLVGPEKAAAISAQLLALPADKRLAYVTSMAGTHKTGQEALKLFFKDAHMQDTGGQIMPTNVSTLPGGPAPGAPVAGAVPIDKTQTPDSAAQTSLGYARLGEDRRHHGVVEGQGNLSQPFEVTGPDGRQILAQQNKQTGALVDVNTKQPVYGVQPKQDAATQNALTDVRKVAATVDSLLETFKPEFVGIKGKVGDFKDRYVSQVPGMEDSANEARIVFRQKAATVKNDYIKQITGATVGQGGEEQRLMRAVPDEEKDSPAQYEAKIKQMKVNLDNLPSIIANNPNLNKTAKPASESPSITRTATNPKTGEQVQLVNGKWQPIKR